MNVISIFGSKCRIEIIIICLLVGFIAGGYMLCGCIRPNNRLFEGYTNNPVSAPMSHNPDGGNQYSWVSQQEEEDKTTLGGNDNTYMNNETDSMLVFKDTKTSSTCASQISGYGGMYCVTPEQKTIINTRGGNSNKSSRT
tara:strand:+ start:14620 stop:15039 length:420 start_codon:yes stop_codon:yes gene_type:complete